MLLSLIIPIFKSEESLPDLCSALEQIAYSLNDAELEVVFVVDGSPDRSALCLKNQLSEVSFRSIIIELSKNFGAFAAIRAGLSAGSGMFFAVISADLQEPLTLINDFYLTLREDKSDIVFGKREGREDPLLSIALSKVFWFIYRTFINNDIPEGGVDVFGCNRKVRDLLLTLNESNSSLVGLLFWVGFRREFISYRRGRRSTGKSSWTLRKKFKYFTDSVFSFSDLPIRLLIFFGTMGIITSFGLGLLTLFARLSQIISIPGYSATVLIMLFFGGLNSLGLGILGLYVWRAFENTKGRPLAIIMKETAFSGKYHDLKKPIHPR
jgi:glycosyltransferase involved in cell wall biosynthesis